MVGKKLLPSPTAEWTKVKSHYQTLSKLLQVVESWLSILAGGTELAPNLVTDKAFTQKLQDYKYLTSDKNPKAEDFAALPRSSTVKTISGMYEY